MTRPTAFPSDNCLRAKYSRQDGAALRIFTSFILILSVFPYLTVPGIPAFSQVQPWAAAISWVGMFYVYIKGNLNLKQIHLVVITFSIFSAVYVHASTGINLDYYLRKSSSFFVSFPIVVMAQYIKPVQVIKVVKISSIIWCGFALLGVYSPDVYREIVPSIVPDALGAFGDRGQTSLAPEATDFGFTMVYLLAIYRISAACFPPELRRAYVPNWVYLVLAVNIVLSKSASGVFALILVVVVYLIENGGGKEYRRATYRNMFVITIATSFVIFMITQMGPLSNTTGIRGLDLLLAAIGSPSGLLDTTFSYRVAHNLVGLFGLLDSGLAGFGAGSFILEGSRVYWSYGIGAMLGLQGWYAYNVPVTLEAQPLAFFPVLLFEYGLIGLVYCIALFYSILKSKVPLRLIAFTMMFLTWAQSFPAAYPLFWILVGVSANGFFREPRIPANLVNGKA